jgi:hypothetical protein
MRNTSLGRTLGLDGSAVRIVTITVALSIGFAPTAAAGHAGEDQITEWNEPMFKAAQATGTSPFVMTGWPLSFKQRCSTR